MQNSELEGSFFTIFIHSLTIFNKRGKIRGKGDTRDPLKGGNGDGSREISPVPAGLPLVVPHNTKSGSEIRDN